YSMIFLAFATFFPEYEFLIMFILPVKVKYLAWFTVAGLMFAFANVPSARISIVFSMLNYLIAFGPSFYRQTMNQNAAVRRRGRFEQDRRPDGEVFHKCASCGKTDVDDPSLEFRVTEDGEEYCSVCRPKKEVAKP